MLETYLQNIRVNYPSLLDRDELRETAFGLIDSAIAHTNAPESILSEDFKTKAKQSQGRTIDVPVYNRGNLTVGSARSCSIGSFENDSDIVNVTWNTVTADISMVPAQYEKNEMSYLQDLARKIIEAKEAMMQVVEDAIYTALDTNKTTVFTSTLVGAGAKYPLTGNALQVAAADWDYFFNDIKAIQMAGEFRPAIHYVEGSANLMPTVEKFINQGAGNSENTKFQFADKVFRFSNSVVDTGGARATGFFMPNGTIGLLTRVDNESRLNMESSDGTEWSTTVLDGMPWEVGVQYKSNCSDQSALNTTGMEHATATLKEFWQFSFDYAIVLPYNSDPGTKEGSIKKFDLIP